MCLNYLTVTSANFNGRKIVPSLFSDCRLEGEYINGKFASFGVFSYSYFPNDFSKNFLTLFECHFVRGKRKVIFRRFFDDISLHFSAFIPFNRSGQQLTTVSHTCPSRSSHLIDVAQPRFFAPAVFLVSKYCKMRFFPLFTGRPGIVFSQQPQRTKPLNKY